MLKKYIGLGLFLCLFFVFNSPISAENIGYLDMQEVTASYKKFEKLQEEFRKKEEKLKKEAEKKQKQLEKAQDQNKSEEQLRKMKEKFDEQLKPKIEAFQMEQMKKMKEIEQEILDATNKISKAYGIDVVLHKQIVLKGGFDVTKLVIEDLNK